MLAFNVCDLISFYDILDWMDEVCSSIAIHLYIYVYIQLTQSNCANSLHMFHWLAIGACTCTCAVYLAPSFLYFFGTPIPLFYMKVVFTLVLYVHAHLD